MLVCVGVGFSTSQSKTLFRCEGDGSGATTWRETPCPNSCALGGPQIFDCR